jgi:hypothetical protein
MAAARYSAGTARSAQEVGSHGRELAVVNISGDAPMRALKIVLYALVLATLAGCVVYGGHGDWHHHYWGW